MYESEKTEFKLILTDDIYKEIIAFANTFGGVIYIGMDDNGKVVGIENVDDTYTRLTNGVRDAISPDITMFIEYELLDNKVIKINVLEGMSKPYYLKSKGIKPNGVYVRQGASKAPATQDMIRKMIKLSDGDNFESSRSIIQELSFNECIRAFKENNVEFSKDKYLNLGIYNVNNTEYTNLALVLSDQCPYSVKVGVFGDDNNTVFKDRKEFNGSIFRQLEETCAYLQLCNRTVAKFEGIKRIDYSDYPEVVLREALLNSLVHRDYQYSGSIIININKRFIEFISIGGLMPGLTKSDICNGISLPRNKKLAEIFYRLKLIESYGTGIRKIFSFYKDCPIKPQIETTDNTFKLVIPNLNEIEEVNNNYNNGYTYNNTFNNNTIVKENSINYNVTPQMREILDYLQENGEMSMEDIQDLLEIKRTRAYTISKSMVDSGMISTKGRGESRRFFIK